MKKKLLLMSLVGVLVFGLAGCGSSTNADSDKDIKELEERIEELEAENEELRENSNNEEKELELPVVKEQETWADDYIIPFSDDAIYKKVRDITKITERDITYGDIKYIAELTIGWCDDASCLRFFTGLEKLQIGERALINLDKLDVSNLHNLKELKIVSASNLTTIEGLENLDKLSYVTFDNCENLENLDVSNLRNLTGLTIIYARELETIDGMENLDKLSYVLFENCNNLDISILSKNIHLKELEIIAECWKQYDLSFLLEFEGLERLIISSKRNGEMWDNTTGEYIDIDKVNMGNLQEWVDTH